MKTKIMKVILFVSVVAIAVSVKYIVNQYEGKTISDSGHTTLGKVISS